MPYYKLISLVVNSFSANTEKFYPQIYKLYSQVESYKNLSHGCSLILSFDVLNQIIAHRTGAKIHSDILVYENFHNNEIPKEDSQCICLSVILIDSVFRTVNNYYPQLFLEKCEYFVAGRKTTLLLTTKKFLLILIEKILIKKILMKKIKNNSYKLHNSYFKANF